MDLTSTEVGGTVATAELTNLPSGNRNFTGFVALLPGVVYNPTADSSSDNVTINGQHGSGVVFLMDGGSNNDDLRGGSAGAQARTAARGDPGVPGRHQPVRRRLRRRHRRRHQRRQQAGHQRASAAARSATSPTQALTAKDFFVAQQDLEKPDAQRKQWGGTVGGPIVRDKMHFFFSFERSDLDEGRSRVYPTRPDKSFTATQQTNSYNSMRRIDHQINSSVQLLGPRACGITSPTYNQVLGDGTINTLYTEKDDDVTAGRHLQLDHRADAVADAAGARTSRNSPTAACRSTSRAPWTEAPPMLDFLSYYDQAGNEYADVRQDEGLRLRHAVHVVRARCAWAATTSRPACSTSSASTCATTSATPTAASSSRPTSTTTRPTRATYPERFTVRVPGARPGAVPDPIRSAPMCTTSGR